MEKLLSKEELCEEYKEVFAKRRKEKQEAYEKLFFKIKNK